MVVYSMNGNFIKVDLSLYLESISERDLAVLEDKELLDGLLEPVLSLLLVGNEHYKINSIERVVAGTSA